MLSPKVLLNLVYLEYAHSLVLLSTIETVFFHFFLLTSNLIRKRPLLDQCRGASVYRRCLRGVLPTEMRLRRIRGSRLQQQKSSGLGETRRRRRLERRRRILRKDGADEASSRVGQEKRKMKVGV